MSTPLSRRDFLAGAAAGGAALGGLGKAPAVLAQARAPLKLGVLLPYSKVYAQLGRDITDGMSLYFDKVGGTAGGRKVEMIKEDEELEPRVGIQKTRKLIEQDQVDLMTGIVSTHIAYAIRDIVDSAKMMLVVSNAGGNALTRDRKSPYIFRTSFTSWQISYPMGEWVAKHVSKKLLLTAADYAFGAESIAAFKESYAAAGGEVVGELKPKLGETDYAPYLGQIRSARPEAIYAFFSGSDAVRFVKQFDEYGLKKDIKLTCAGFLVEEDVLGAQGRAALDALSSLHWAISLDNAENKAFTAAYQKAFGRPASVFALQGYDTGRVIVEALNKTGGDTSNKERLIQALEGVRFDSPRGSFAFDPATHHVRQNIYVRRVTEGQGGLHNTVLGTIATNLSDRA
jgi:branched-chain amino acid transport system substrate-binding protein